MFHAARALAHEFNPNLSEDHAEVASEFKKHLVEGGGLFLDPFVGAKFANYFFAAHEHGPRDDSRDAARELIEEAQLFVDACHACHQKILASAKGAAE